MKPPKNKKVIFLQNGIEKAVVGILTHERSKLIRITNEFGSVLIPTRNIVSVTLIDTKHHKSSVNVSTKHDNAPEPAKMLPDAFYKRFSNFFCKTD